MKLYSFDGVDATLELLPLAARRALDLAGLKLSLEAWRVLPLTSRRAIVQLGSGPAVDVAQVEGALGNAQVARLARSADPYGMRTPQPALIVPFIFL